MRPSKIIGITGGIGTGKSTVSNYLRSMGYKVIDADKINHRIMSEKDTALKIAKEFGRDILDENGEIDRRALGDIVFWNLEDLRRLENILHPIIFKEMKREIEISDDGLIFLDIPLLFETLSEINGVGIEFDHIVTVYLEREIQIDRIKTRDELSHEEILKRLDAQLSLDKKAEKSSHVLENSSTIEHLKRQVDKFLDEVENEDS